MSDPTARATEAAISVIIDVGGTIDFRVQDVVRAVISAMREPTSEMIEAGKNALAPNLVWDASLVFAWRAMIDEALK